MSAERVGVLEVLDAEVATLRSLESWVNEALAPTRADAQSAITALAEARAAVAELIEADREYDEALRLSRIGYGSDIKDMQAAARLREASARRAAALARIGGAA